ncbi:MAG: Tol-Pal system beta propeller repeat protein TolB [Legionellaceae bacterium]|nr:Tol-Pal system beta propeller repeat protein TolB [Legionellaceae bacterium]
MYGINSLALDLELTQGIASAIPVGIDQFSPDEDGQLISTVLKNDLRLSGQFKLVNAPGASRQEISTDSWKNAGADSIVSGSITSLGNQGLEVRLELIDAVNKGRLLLSKSFKIQRPQLRDLAHHFSDLVYQKLTGERGIFSTKIAYILVQQQGNKKRYSLEVADADGDNPQSLLVSSEPIMSPAWSSDGKKIAYVSFERKKAQIYTVALASGKRRLVTDFDGINGAPAWSPDGKKLAVVLSKNGHPKIYEVDLANGNLHQVTQGSSIDTEPNYAADGKSLLFTSGRGGSPQIYRLQLATGKVERISFDGNYNARASLTPDQKNMVMLHREDKHFNIGVQSMSNARVTRLTFSPMDESPSLAPNGRLILYATRFKEKGVLAIVSLDGRIRMRLPSRDGDVQEPAWSPYLA